ncbi:MAG: branched-chain amino acid ABC transporter substrate-binding protein [Chloroflexi bacterium]|nr:branched-chain amino acid ABC transporter substrate-binding protein [Chloroflexota bacterium]
MNRKFALALAAILLTSIFCGPTPTPTPTNPPSSTIPSDSNQEVVDGDVGTPAEGIPVDCGTATGNINIPAGSFSGTETISIDCLSTSEQTQLDEAVENSTGQTGEVLGAIKLSPSGMQFDSFVTITIPLIRQVSAQYVDVYIFDEDNNNLFEEVVQAQVNCTGWCAQASVNHFTTFIAFETAAIPVPVTEPPTVPPVTFTCTDPLGCINYAPGEPVRLAALLSYSGESGSAVELAYSNEKGFFTAIDDYGEIKGHGIEAVTFDDGCNSDLASASAERIVNDPSIAGVVGTICSGAAIAAMSYFSGAGYTMISPSNTRTSLTAPGTHPEGYFRISAADGVEARGMAIYAYEYLGARYVSVAYEGNDYSKELAETFSAQFLELGGKILDTDEIYDMSIYQEIIYTRIAAGQQTPDAIYFPLPAFGSSFANITYEYYGDSVALLGLSSMTFNNTYVDESGSSGYTTHYPRIVPDYFERSFEFGYDVTTLLLEAIAKVAEVDADGTMHIGRQAIRDVLYARRNFPGKTGTLTCNQYGDCGQPVIEIYRYNSVGEFGGEFKLFTTISP